MEGTMQISGFSKGIRTFISRLFTLIQFIPLAEGWISYGLGSIAASLFTPISYFSFLWYPLDVLCKYIWIGCDWLKLKLWNKNFTRVLSARRFDEHFPIF